MKWMAIMALAPLVCAQSSYMLRSPNQRIEVKIRAGDRIHYDVVVNGKPLLQDSTASISIDHSVLGRNLTVKSGREGSVDQVLEPTVHQKFARIRDHYNELRLETDGRLAVTFRAYDEGVAYRLETTLPKDQVKVYDEEAAFRFAGNYKVFYPQEESFFSHNERLYVPRSLTEIPPAAIATLPAVVDADGIKVAIAESDV